VCPWVGWWVGGTGVARRPASPARPRQFLWTTVLRLPCPAQVYRCGLRSGQRDRGRYSWGGCTRGPRDSGDGLWLQWHFQYHGWSVGLTASCIVYLGQFSRAALRGSEGGLPSAPPFCCTGTVVGLVGGSCSMPSTRIIIFPSLSICAVGSCLTFQAARSRFPVQVRQTSPLPPSVTS
jgi:hypothetical protein